MNKNIGIVIGIGALLVIVGGVYASMKNNDSAMMEKAPIEQKAMENKDVMKESVAKEDVMKESATKEDASMKSGTYEAYSPEKIAMASANHDVVLFFRAGWCPTCRFLDANIKANLEKIPSSLTILDVNYDNSAELKQKYSVTYQHTFVQVDANGNLIKKWSGSPSLAELVAQVK